jgi:hypothetical protein
MGKEALMKKIATLIGFAALLAAADGLAAPSSMSFAGRLSTSSGPVNGNILVTFAVHGTATGGVAAWTDTLPLFADQGLVLATLGNPTNPLDDTVFTGTAMFLEITVEGETLIPRLPITSSPYAIRSTSAATADIAVTADTATTATTADTAVTAATLGTLTPSQVVTSVSAGTGLAGGGAGGALALSIDTATVQARLTSSCATGQSIRAVAADGTVTCEVDDNTIYTPGPGIVISGTTVALTSCPTGQIVKSTGASWACQSDNDTIYTASTGISINAANQISANTGVIQNRVSGSCTVGSAIRAIGADGTVTCQAATGGGGVVFTNLHQFGSSSATPTGTPTLYRTFGTFTKTNASSVIEIVWNGEVSGSPIGGGLCQYQLRIDGAQGSGLDPIGAGTVDLDLRHKPVSQTSMWTGLVAGTHTVSLFLRGTATNCSYNADNFDSTLLVKEYL